MKHLSSPDDHSCASHCCFGHDPAGDKQSGNGTYSTEPGRNPIHFSLLSFISSCYFTSTFRLCWYLCLMFLSLDPCHTELITLCFFFFFTLRAVILPPRNHQLCQKDKSRERNCCICVSTVETDKKIYRQKQPIIGRMSILSLARLCLTGLDMYSSETAQLHLLKLAQLLSISCLI